MDGLVLNAGSDHTIIRSNARTSFRNAVSRIGVGGLFSDYGSVTSGSGASGIFVTRSVGNNATGTSATPTTFSSNTGNSIRQFMTVHLSTGTLVHCAQEQGLTLGHSIRGMSLGGRMTIAHAGHALPQPQGGWVSVAEGAP